MSPLLRPTDRAIRLIVGIAALSFFGALPAPWKYLTLIGLPIIGTALAGWCPLYALFPSGKGGTGGPVGRNAGG